MSRLLSVSIPDELMAQTEDLAEASGRSKSEVVRDALRDYAADQRWRDVYSYGRDRAEAAGVGPEDVEALVDEFRAERRSRKS